MNTKNQINDNTALVIDEVFEITWADFCRDNVDAGDQLSEWKQELEQHGKLTLGGGAEAISEIRLK